jgi:hypothetical protein
VFPNPQEALPLPPRPDVGQYRKLAKDLVKACASGAPEAIGAWAERWLESLRRARGELLTERVRNEMDRSADAVEAFAVRKLTAGTRKCALTDAQFVLARSHGFESWPKLVSHLVAHGRTETAGFEAAVDAIVAGDEDTLRRLLRANPGLIRARSTREHRCTLLHYVSANGVEGYRQKTPPNAVRIAEILLDAGAEVDAEADVYGGRCTTLGLVATSVHPYLAGVQDPLMQVLLDRGANVNHADMVGNRHSTILGCLANGRGAAADYLARRGARLGLVEAAGVGRLDVVRTFFDELGRAKPGVTEKEPGEALLHASGRGFVDVAAFLLDRGVDLGAHDVDKQTALHHAVMGGKLGMIELLIGRGAPLEARNAYGGTVLGQAVWSAAHGGDPDDYAAILETLIAAGAKVAEAHPPVNEKVDAVLARHGCMPDPTRHWFGEEPRKRKS